MEDNALWIKTQLDLLAQKTQDLSELEKKTFSESYLIGAINRVPELAKSIENLTAFKADVEELITLFPLRNEKGKFDAIPYQKKMGTFKSSLQKKYKLVSKDYYISIWLPMGIALGLPYGLMFKNLTLGIPIGLGIGVAIGASLDRKAAKENRVI